MARTSKTATRNRIIGAVLLAALVVAMALNTKFLTPDELAAARPKAFSPPQEAATLFTKAQQELPGTAAPLSEVLPALQSDVKAAAAKYKAVSPSENAYVFAVKATGEVTEGSDASLRLKVAGAPEVTPILVPLSTAVNGTVLRDGMGFKFADAPGQTDYQYVGDEIKKLILSKVVDPLGDPAELKGKQVDVVGVFSVQDSGGPVPRAKPVNIQPVSIEAR